MEIFIYIIYFLLILIASYYVNLFLTKDEYTKDELKNVIPYLKNYWDKIKGNYSLIIIIIILVISSLIGYLIPAVITHWITNSSIFFVIVFFVLPIIKKRFEITQVTSSENYSDKIANIFVKYIDIIIIGFGSGLGSALISNWRKLIDIHSFWFVLNIVIVSIFLGISFSRVTED
ncbi:hypothetical protein ACFL20_08330 [Spirochaetota bacterium]